MIGIIDYGLGNLASVAGAVERVGFEPVITSDPETLAHADKLILPGVGAFGDGMANLREHGLDKSLNGMVIDGGKPILGICLGFQLMARSSDEFGHHKGLGWIDADVVALTPPDGLRVPHVGWNDLVPTAGHALWDGLDPAPLVYFVHSHHMVCDDVATVAATTDYGGDIIAAVAKDHIWATQFHPEKSQRAGLRILENFLKA